MSRSADAILAELMSLLPPGSALPRDPASNTGRFLAPIAAEMATIEADWDRLLGQITPGNATDLLPDYERVLGPDPCGRDLVLMTPAERQINADLRWTANGDPTPAEFVGLAARLGIAVRVETFTPPRFGGAVFGRRRGLGPQAYGWKIHAAPTAVIKARFGRARFGQPRGRIVPPLIECVLRQWVPLHTLAAFVYDGSV